MEISLDISGIYKILNKICVSLKDPESPEAWRGNVRHSHTLVTRYLRANPQITNRLVLLGIKEKVMHSIVLDRNKKIVCDSYDLNMKFNRVSFDGNTYKFTFNDETYTYSKILEFSRSELDSFCGGL